MGFIHPGVPQELVLRLAKEFGVGTFVETGTHKGNTSAWASSHFSRVVTIEGSELWYERTKPRLEALGNVSMFPGHSREVLPKVVEALSGPAIFWLDAHWSGRQTAGADEQCPLLDEIAAVNRAAQDTFILIDDARLFLAPPEPPHDVNQWPDIGATVAALNACRPRYVVVFEDAIIAVPLSARASVQAHCLGRMAAIKNRTFSEKLSDKVSRVFR
jgi:hypothetical protein